MIESKNRENQSLTRKAESLKSENIRLRDFNDKSLGLLLEIASTNPEIREMIVNEIPELRINLQKMMLGWRWGKSILKIYNA